MIPKENESAEKWDEETAKQLRAMALRLLNEHGHGHVYTKRPISERTNCGACELNNISRRPMPNYAGWLRVYIQAGKPVSKRLMSQEICRAKRENKLYYEAIMRDLATFTE